MSCEVTLCCVSAFCPSMAMVVLQCPALPILSAEVRRGSEAKQVCRSAGVEMRLRKLLLRAFGILRLRLAVWQVKACTGCPGQWRQILPPDFPEGMAFLQPEVPEAIGRTVQHHNVHMGLSSHWGAVAGGLEMYFLPPFRAGWLRSEVGSRVWSGLENWNVFFFFCDAEFSWRFYAI